MTDEWGRELTNRIAGQIRKLREPRSVQWLEDRTVELGSRVSRSTISELETGQRKTITLADVLILAAALEVSFADLVYPGDSDVEMLPGKLVPRRKAVETLIADEELVNSSAQKLAKEIGGIVSSMEAKLAQVNRLYELARSATDDVARISNSDEITAGIREALDSVESRKRTSHGR